MGTENDKWPLLNLWPLPWCKNSTMLSAAFLRPEHQARLYCKHACAALLPNNESHILHEDWCVEGGTLISFIGCPVCFYGYVLTCAYVSCTCCTLVCAYVCIIVCFYGALC